MSATAPLRVSVARHHSVAAPVSAPLQTSGNFALPQTVFAGGGGVSNGGSFQMQSTSGQSLTGVSSGSSFNLASGFWPSGTPCSTITVTNPAVASTTAGTAFSQSFTQSGGVGATTFSTVNALPTGLILLPSGVLSGTPTQVGTFGIVVKATDSNGCNGTGTTYSLVIGCPTAATLPTTLPNGTGGTAYSASVTATPSGTYVYSVTAGALPDGLTFNAATGALTGTPMMSNTFNFTITATRYGACASSQAYSVSIACPRLIDLSPKPQVASGTGVYTNLPVATVDRTYTTTVTATPAGGNYIFILIPSPQSLPPGLSLNSNTGVIAGTATVTGSYSRLPDSARAAAGGCIGCR